MIQTFLAAYAAALLSFSPEKISEFYQTPLAVYSDDGLLTVEKMSDVVDFWKKGVKPYEKMNIAKAVPEVLSEERLSETLWMSKVKWTNYDKAGKIIAQETNLYILSKQKNELKISGLIIMNK